MHTLQTVLLVTVAAAAIVASETDGVAPATMTYQEAARYIGVHHNTLRRLVADGSVKHLPIRGGTVIRFRRTDLDNYLDAIARGGAPS